MAYDAAQLALLHNVEAFTHRLIVALVNLELHADDNSDVVENLERLLADLASVFASGATPPLELRFQEQQIRFDSQPLIGASLQAGKLLRLCRARSISALEFGSGLERQEVQRFLRLLADDAHLEAFRPESVARALIDRGITGIAVYLRGDGANGSAAATRGSSSAIRDYQELSDLLQDSHVAAHRGEHLALDRTFGLVEQTVSHMDQELSGLLALAMYDDIDSFTVGHSVRVTLLALQVAIAAGADRAELLRVGTAALLHDIGKSRIPQHVLFKQGPLEGEEIEIMRAHARLGGEILLEQKDLDPAAIGAAFCHHMGPGDTGYPRPAVPFEPSGISKLVRVADVFEALTSVRPYKAALTPVHAYAIMHRMQRAFDVRWLKLFTRVIGLFPIGTRVELDDGSQATVVNHGPSPHQPQVRVESGSSEEALVMIGAGHAGERRRISAVLGVDDRVEIPWQLLRTRVDDAAVCGCDVRCEHKRLD